jgi:tetratricopeptide (TPR) repeat protein
MKNKPFFLIPATLVFFLTAGLQLPAVYAAPMNLRQIKVGVAVFLSFKTIPNWKYEFERRLAYASKIFETEFKLRLQPAVYWNWRPCDEKRETHYLLEELRSGFPLRGIDMVMGLTRLSDIPDPSQVKDLHVIGQARPFSGYLVLRYPHHRLFRIQQETVLVHELGHMFGAVHTGNRNSIMSPVVERQIPSSFDEENREIVKLTRQMDFRKGTEELDSGTLQQLINSYLILAIKNQSFDFYYALGFFYVKLNQNEEALKTWQEAARLDDKNPQVHFDLGMLYFKLNKADESIRELSRAVSGFQYTHQRSSKTYALKTLGQLYLEKNNTAGAFNAFSRAKPLAPDDPDIPMYLAVVQIKRGQPEEAIKSLRDIVKKNPRHIKARVAPGTAYGEGGYYDEALTHLNQAAEMIRSQGGNVLRASDLSQIVEIHQQVGNIYLKQKKTGEALREFQQACELNPSSECHKRLGQIYYQYAKWDDCIRELMESLKYNKEDADAYGFIGVALTQKGEDANAISVFREGLRYVQDKKAEARLHKNIGNLLNKARQWDPALQEFHLAIAKDWHNEESHFGMAIAYLGKNQAISGREYLQNVLRINPNNRKAQDMLKRIEKVIAE